MWDGSASIQGSFLNTDTSGPLFHDLVQADLKKSTYFQGCSLTVG